MTTYNRQSNVAIGDLYTASMHNTLLDNLHAFWTNASAGGLPYWSAANAVATLAKPANLAVLINNGSIPAWLEKGAAGTFLGVNASGQLAYGFAGAIMAQKFDTTGHNYASTSWRNMPNSSGSIVLPAGPTYTIQVTGLIVHVAPTQNYGFRDFQVRIDGENVGVISSEKYQINEQVTTPIGGMATGVEAGTRTILIRERAELGEYDVARLYWHALATAEPA